VGGPDGPTVRVRVPATSANLGPGFDSLGLALALYDEVELSVLPAGRESVVEVHGEGAGRVPCDERHLVLRAVRATYELAGLPEALRPPLRLVCRNAIPHSRGLGSSAAAAVAGIVAARALLRACPGPDSPDVVVPGAAAVLDLASGFDGHADNVAACLTGGLALSWGAGPGSFRSVRLEPHPWITPVVFVSDRTSSTDATRGLLPDRVPHADAAFTAARAALAVHAITAAPDLLLPATEDRLHQPYRRPAYPETAALVDALRSAGVPATVSGAGPTVLALVDATGSPDALSAVDVVHGIQGVGFRRLDLPVDTDGAVADLR